MFHAPATIAADRAAVPRIAVAIGDSPRTTCIDHVAAQRLRGVHGFRAREVEL